MRVVLSQQNHGTGRANQVPTGAERFRPERDVHGRHPLMFFHVKELQ
jgi:hypothetical protein